VRVRLAGEERTDRGLLLRGDRVRKGNLVGGEVPAAALPGGPAARRLRGYGDLVGGGHGGLLLAGGALVGLLRALTFRGGGPPPVAAGQEAGVRRGTRGQRRGVGGTAAGAHHPVPAAALVVVPDGGHRRGSTRTRPSRVGAGTHPCVSRVDPQQRDQTGPCTRRRPRFVTFTGRDPGGQCGQSARSGRLTRRSGPRRASATPGCGRCATTRGSPGTGTG